MKLIDNLIEKRQVRKHEKAARAIQDSEVF